MSLPFASTENYLNYLVLFPNRLDVNPVEAPRIAALATSDPRIKLAETALDPA